MPETIPITIVGEFDSRKVEAQLRKLTSKTRVITLKDGTATNIKSMTRAVQTFDTSLDKATDRVVSFGLAAAVFTGVTKSIQAFAVAIIDVEDSLTKINVNLGESTEGLKKFSSDLFNVARQTGQTFETASKAAEEFARQGLGAEETILRTKDALILSRIAAIDSTEAVNDLTAAVNSYAKEALTTTEIINKFVALDTQFAVSSADLAAGIQRAGAVASDAGISFDKFLALLTAVKQETGRSGAVIGNAFKTIFERVRSPATLKLFQELGIATKDLEGQLLPVDQILQNLADSFDNLGQAQQQQVSKAVANIQQINIFKTLLGDLSKTYSITSKAALISANAQDQAIVKNIALNQTLKSLINSTQVSVEQFFAAVGNQSLGPAFKALLNGFEEVRRYLSKDGGDQAGQDFGDSLIRGVSKVITGPGLAVIAFGLGSALKKVIGRVAGELQGLIGINSIAATRASIQQTINGLLQQANEKEKLAFESGSTLLAQREALLSIQVRINQELVKSNSLTNSLLVGGMGGFNLQGRGMATIPLPGVITSHADPLASAISREIAAGVPKASIYIDTDSRLKGPSNPKGLLVANRRDEPGGGWQGVSRVIAAGGNPRIQSKINIPHFAKDQNLLNSIRESMSGVVGGIGLSGGVPAFPGIAPGSKIISIQKSLESYATSLIEQDNVAKKAIKSQLLALTKDEKARYNISKALQDIDKAFNAQYVSALKAEKVSKKAVDDLVRKSEKEKANLTREENATAKKTANASIKEKEKLEKTEAATLKKTNATTQRAAERAERDAKKKEIEDAKTAQRLADNAATKAEVDKRIQQQKDAELDIAAKNKATVERAAHVERSRLALGKNSILGGASIFRTENQDRDELYLGRQRKFGERNVRGRAIGPFSSAVAPTAPTAQGLEYGEEFEKIIRDRKVARRQRLNNVSFGVSFAASFGSGLVPEGQGGTKKGQGLGAASGALQGLGVAGIFGPEAAAAGAVIGALVGYIGKANESLEEFTKRLDVGVDAQKASVLSIQKVLDLQSQIGDLTNDGGSPIAIAKLQAKSRQNIAGEKNPEIRELLSKGFENNEELKDLLEKQLEVLTKLEGQKQAGVAGKEISKQGFLSGIGSFAKEAATPFQKSELKQNFVEENFGPYLNKFFGGNSESTNKKIRNQFGSAGLGVANFAQKGKSITEKVLTAAVMPAFLIPAVKNLPLAGAKFLQEAGSSSLKDKIQNTRNLASSIAPLLNKDNIDKIDTKEILANLNKTGEKDQVETVANLQKIYSELGIETAIATEDINDFSIALIKAVKIFKEIEADEKPRDAKQTQIFVRDIQQKFLDAASAITSGRLDTIGTQAGLNTQARQSLFAQDNTSGASINYNQESDVRLLGINKKIETTQLENKYRDLLKKEALAGKLNSQSSKEVAGLGTFEEVASRLQDVKSTANSNKLRTQLNLDKAGIESKFTNAAETRRVQGNNEQVLAKAARIKDFGRNFSLDGSETLNNYGESARIGPYGSRTPRLAAIKLEESVKADEELASISDQGDSDEAKAFQAERVKRDRQNRLNKLRQNAADSLEKFSGASKGGQAYQSIYGVSNIAVDRGLNVLSKSKAIPEAIRSKFASYKHGIDTLESEMKGNAPEGKIVDPVTGAGKQLEEAFASGQKLLENVSNIFAKLPEQLSSMSLKVLADVSGSIKITSDGIVSDDTAKALQEAILSSIKPILENQSVRIRKTEEAQAKANNTPLPPSSTTSLPSSTTSLPSSIPLSPNGKSAYDPNKNSNVLQ